MDQKKEQKIDFVAKKTPIRIMEVGPRDGLQNEKTQISLTDKIQFIDHLIESGIQEIEITSLVRKEKIPQLSDAQELLAHYQNHSHWKHFWVLIPNKVGLEKAVDLKVRNVAFFTSASELFNQRNINSSVQESMQRIQEMISYNNELPTHQKMHMRVYLSMVFGCPYEGDVPYEKTFKLIEQLLQWGITDFEIGDTIGVAGPKQVEDFLKQLKQHFHIDQFAMHFHDTRGMGIANVLISLEVGIKSFSSSAGGIGGCPYALGSAGNVATEEVIYLFERFGLTNLPDPKKVAQAAIKLNEKIHRPMSSKLSQYYQKNSK
ncbi:MAG: hydroxymethylglutaryl-CoA lyase [Bacteriovoracaceae bacterium]|nr:hydroxymethylglutaryl-CoA lyase [Bacteriovoracaceae bacterium]